MTIPVIVRLGNLEATAGIANVKLDKKDGKPAVDLDLSRSGTRSTFGEVRVLKAGVKDPIAVQKAVAVYTEIGTPPPVDPARPGLPGRPARSGHRPICRDLRRRLARDRTKPTRCCARRGREARGLMSVLGGRNWLRKAAMLAGALRRRRCRVRGAAGSRHGVERRP